MDGNLEFDKFKSVKYCYVYGNQIKTDVWFMFLYIKKAGEPNMNMFVYKICFWVIG
jgi:hypothetical protein